MHTLSRIEIEVVEVNLAMLEKIGRALNKSEPYMPLHYRITHLGMISALNSHVIRPQNPRRMLKG
ncbi:hypothetical protein BC938DRAFT_479631, partial [Jimgerdemannia flammicorona]